MSDKLQFVGHFHHSPTAESLDKLQFVGHFLSLPAVSLGTALVVISDSKYLHKTKATVGEFLIIRRSAENAYQSGSKQLRSKGFAIFNIINK